MPRVRAGLALLTSLTALLMPGPANAKDSGPLRLVAESGKVGWIRGTNARAWWADLESVRSRTCACPSANATATFVSRLMQQARWPFHNDGDWPSGVMLIQSGHSAPWLYYPASRTTPPLLVSPATVGKAPLQWDSWHVVTPRMQRMIAAALTTGNKKTSVGASSRLPHGWTLAGGILFLIALTLVAWRRKEIRIA